MIALRTYSFSFEPLRLYHHNFKIFSLFNQYLSLSLNLEVIYLSFLSFSLALSEQLYSISYSLFYPLSQTFASSVNSDKFFFFNLVFNSLPLPLSLSQSLHHSYSLSLLYFNLSLFSQTLPPSLTTDLSLRTGCQSIKLVFFSVSVSNLSFLSALKFPVFIISVNRRRFALFHS